MGSGKTPEGGPPMGSAGTILFTFGLITGETSWPSSKTKEAPKTPETPETPDTPEVPPPIPNPSTDPNSQDDENKGT